MTNRRCSARGRSVVPVEVGLLVVTVHMVLGVLLVYPAIGSGAGVG
jgi:hypothetical protein